MSDKRVIVVGATGMIGGIALRLCLEDPAVSRVTVVVRRSTGITHPNLREVIHQDFLDFSAVADELEQLDTALYCLGAYTGAVPDDEFRRITMDFTIAFARALHQRSPQAAFSFLSGQGADPTGRSRMAFARYKGAAETALLSVGFPRVHIFRPGYIYPVTPRHEPNLGYRVMRAVYPAIRHIVPNLGISSDDLARAMVQAALHGTEQGNLVLENRDIRAMATPH